VVRGYAFERLTADDRTTTYNHIRNYFEGQPKEDPAKVTEVGQLRPALEIYYALLGAGRLDEAAGFYIDRLSKLLFYSLGTYHLVIELLTPLFADGTDAPPPLTDEGRQSTIMTDLASMFAYTGQTEKALVLEGQIIKLDLDRRSASDLGVSLRNYANSLRSDNQLAAALHCRELARDLAAAAREQKWAGKVNTVFAWHLYRYRAVGCRPERLRRLLPESTNLSGCILAN
jgi:hypothetical protein